MSKKTRTKYIHENKYVAEVDVQLVESDDGWSPYLSLEDAYKLDDVRAALRRGDLQAVARSARLYSKQPIAL